MSVYSALLKSLEHREPDAPTVVNYLVARGYERPAIQSAIRLALDKGDVNLGPGLNLVLALSGANK